MRNHLCHCQYTANPVQMDDLDITLVGLILLNCCNLGPAEENAIKGLRKFKNNYLSHNTKGRITLTEYNTLWPDLTRLVLQLDSTKQDDLIRMENRPIDESMCIKYCIELLDVHNKLEEMNDFIQQIDESIQENNVMFQAMRTSLQNVDTSVQGMNTSVQGNSVFLQEINTAVLRMDTALQELLQRDVSCHCHNKPSQSPLPVKLYKLGQSIFHLHHQFDLVSVPNSESEGIGWVTGGVMMYDGRLLLCLHDMKRLLICNTDGSQTEIIPLKYRPWYVIAVNNSTVAVLSGSSYIEIYEVNNKTKLKSMQLPDGQCGGMTTINNKLVVAGIDKLYIIDYQTGEVVQTIEKEESDHKYWVPCVHATSDRIFYSDMEINRLYCYSYTDDKHSTTTLPSRPWSITGIQDGSMYVVCTDGSVQHVSSDGKLYKTVTTNELKSLGEGCVISYNKKQRKLVTFNLYGTVNVFNESEV